MKKTLSMLILSGIVSTSAVASDKVMMILDESGSMWGQIDGKAKIEIAQETIGHLLNDWKSDVQLGVMAYGHREKGSCDDIELIAPVGKVDAAVLTSKINALKPKGKTPIAASLKKAAEALKSSEEKATILLLSDGLETCEADPCLVASELEKSGVDFTAHVVGFDLKDDELKQLKCIADNTGGQMFSAKNAAELNDALGKVVEQVTVADAVVEEKAQSSLVFEEKFDDAQGFLTHFEIQNEDDERYLVEEGKLLLVSGHKADKPYAPNSFQLLPALPEGDWAMSLIFRPELQRAGQISFGFELGDLTREDKIKKLFAGVSSVYGGEIKGGIWYQSADNKEESVKRASNQYDNSWPGLIKTLGGDDGRFEMQLLRKKRDYIWRMRAIKKDGSAGQWREYGNSTVLKPFKQIRFMATQHKANQKNTASFTVESVKLYEGTPE